MTNDVGQIKKILLKEGGFSSKSANIAILMGDKETAIQEKKRAFFEKLLGVYRMTVRDYGMNEFGEEKYSTEYKNIRLNFGDMEEHIDFDKYDTLEKLKAEIVL